MTDYAMFTAAGDVAVQAIIDKQVDDAVDHNDLYDRVLTDLERLQRIAAFAEATDDVVRERVYQQCLREFPMPVFGSVRG